MVSPLDQMPDMPSQMGVGSGIDTNKMVKDLVQAERAPTEQRLARREEELQEKISALGQARGAIDEFQQSIQGLSDPGAYSGIDAESSNPEVVGISAGEEARPGQYEVEVEQRARTQRLATATGVFEDSSDAVGVGRLTLVAGSGQEQVIEIGEEQSSLLGIRDAINQQTEGLRASIVDDGGGPRLAIATEATGEENAIAQIRAEEAPLEGEPEAPGLGVLQFNAQDAQGQPLPGAFEEIRPANDASVVIDGMRVTRAENRIEGAIEGVTLDIQEEGRARINIQEQTGLAEENVQRLVEAYNQVRGAVNQLTAYDPDTQQAGPLQGDATIRNVESRLGRALTEPVPALEGQPLQAIGDLGVRTNRDGSVELDSESFQQATSQHPELVTRLMTDPEHGVMTRLEDVIDYAVGGDSVLQMRTDGLESRLDRIADDYERLDRRMERREDQLRSQFSRMDSRVAELNQTSDFLKERLAVMNQDD